MTEDEKELKELEDTPIVDATPEQLAEAERIENLLITKGVLIPGKDLVHYMTRSASYMRLITSEQFKESGISLEELLDDEFIQGQFEANAKTAEMMRYVTEQVIEKMQALPTEEPKDD